MSQKKDKIEEEKVKKNYGDTSRKILEIINKNRKKENFKEKK